MEVAKAIKVTDHGRRGGGALEATPVKLVGGSCWGALIDGGFVEDGLDGMQIELEGRAGLRRVLGDGSGFKAFV